MTPRDPGSEAGVFSFRIGFMEAAESLDLTPSPQLPVNDPLVLAKLREAWRMESLGEKPNFARACRTAGITESTGWRWKKAGLLDLDSQRTALSVARAIGPELSMEIARNAGGLVLAAQDQVASTIQFASASEASKIAVDQMNIHQLASGQATSRVEVVSRDDLISQLGDLFEGEATEITDAEVVDAV